MTQTVTVSLASTVVYVTGTVNGVTVVWTKVGANDWQAIAARSNDDVYLVVITAIDNVGNSATYELTLTYGLDLITDRTQSDVSEAKSMRGRKFFDLTEAERTKYLSGLKGAYTPAVDMNRVGNAINYLAGIMQEYGYVVDVSPKTDWQYGEDPTPDDLAKYLQDVQDLRDGVNVLTDTPLPDSMIGIDYVGANNIEKLLKELEQYIYAMIVSFLYAGEIYAGEV